MGSDSLNPCCKDVLGPTGSIGMGKVCRRRRMPDREKLRRADHVVMTGLAKGRTRARVISLWRDLSARQGRIWPP